MPLGRAGASNGGTVRPATFSNARRALALVNASRGLLEVASSWGSTTSRSSFTAEECWALRLGRPYVAERPFASRSCHHIAGDPAGYLCVPMMAEGEVLGVFHLMSTETGTTHTRIERLASAVAEQVSASLANLSLREALRRESIRDSLTGLFNRRYMVEALTRELSKSVRTGRPLAVLMLDIDHFKRFNDAFGHQAGDAVLRGVADYLTAATRVEDIVCRYGGEEIMLILPETSMEGAAALAEQLRLGVKALEVPPADSPRRGVTVSIGVAAYPNVAADAASLIRAADEALYRAKHAGRDRVEVADAGHPSMERQGRSTGE